MNDRKPHILVIDDEETVRRCLVYFFENEGLEVGEAASGAEALGLVREGHSFTVALVDMRLPDMDGTELVLALHDLSPSLRFLVHTGSSDYELPEALEYIGVRPEDIMFKPVIGMERLLEAVVRKGRASRLVS